MKWRTAESKRKSYIFENQELEANDLKLVIKINYIFWKASLI